MSPQPRRHFWRETLALHGSISLHVLPLVLTFGLIAGGIWVTSSQVEKLFGWQLALEVAPHEVGGAVLGVLLVLRTNAGMDRWWEARKLWGGMVNQTRNLVIGALAYGPDDREWRDKFVRWTAVFPHAARLNLRGERSSSKIADLIGPAAADQLASADHMPSFVALKLGDLLRDACDRLALDRFAFLQMDRERALLIDHVGGCERILKTPLPLAYSIMIRRFIVLFLLTLPLALLHRLESDWLVPVITMLVAYPLLSLDQAGIELENPFSLSNLGHLPLDDISETIERNLLCLLMAKQSVASDLR